MRIAVVGGGIFGVSAAVKLARAGHQADLFEKQRDILCAASGINQYRIHRGYHYPRNTIIMLGIADHRLVKFFPEVLFRSK